MAITLSGTSGITLGASSALTFGDASTLPSATFQSIYPISASVASSAMTVTLNPCAIAFRSTTLTSGTTSTVAVPSAITVTIPSGATLGSVSNVQSDVMVVAINNAGTVELAVVIGAGDESGVINTTAISGTSNTIGTYYSTATRSNVPYCVVGFIRSTQVTAGTWNAAPTLVQGFRVAPNGLGYGQTWQSVSRSPGVTYYNTTGKPIVLQVLGYTGSAAGGYLYAQVNGGVTIPIGTVYSAGGSYPGVGTLVVPSGAYYSWNASMIAGTFSYSSSVELR